MCRHRFVAGPNGKLIVQFGMVRFQLFASDRSVQAEQSKIWLTNYFFSGVKPFPVNYAVKIAGVKIYYAQRLTKTNVQDVLSAVSSP